MIKLRINGRDVELEGPTPLVQYLASLGVDQRAVAVELNERILERPELATTILAEGDVVEIVRMVGGGLADVARQEVETTDVVVLRAERDRFLRPAQFWRDCYRELAEGVKPGQRPGR